MDAEGSVTYPRLAADANHDERLAYIAKNLAYLLRERHDSHGRVVQRRWHQRLAHVQSHLRPGVGEWGVTQSIWLHVLEAFGPKTMGSESEQRIRWQCDVVANAIEAEADMVEAKVARAKAPWYHSPDEQKPDRFYLGPLTDTAGKLDAAICPRKKPDPNHRQLKRRGSEGRLLG